MKKIAFVTPYFQNYGGGEIYLNGIANYFNNTADSQYECKIFTADPSAFTSDTAGIPRIDNYHYMVKNIGEVIRTLKKYNPDYLILNDNYISQFSLLFSVFFEKVICLIHGELSTNKYGDSLVAKIITWVRLKSIISGASRVLSVNRTNLALFHYNKRVSYIGNYIDPQKGFFNNKNESYHFIFVGRLVPVKNVGKMLQVFQLYKNQINNDARLCVVGDGELKNATIEAIHKLGLFDNVDLVGHVNHNKVNDFLSQARVLLLFSFSEGMPTCVLEALNLGLPCVVSNVGSNQDIIMNGKNGFVFNLDDSDSTIIEYMDRALSLSSDECKNSVEKYNIDNFVKRFTEQLNL